MKTNKDTGDVLTEEVQQSKDFEIKNLKDKSQNILYCTGNSDTDRLILI